jgi:hypothetical protein
MGISTIRSKLKRGLALTQKESGDLWKYICSLEKQHWTSVSEEPKEQGTYITTIKYGDKYAVGQRYYHGKYVGWEDSCVIAYMPLPQPYKAESKKNVCKDCYYNDGEVHAECVVCDKVESNKESEKLNEHQPD